MSFPSIFCGKKRSDKCQILVQYSTICKWELRSQDHRVAESVPNIFTNACSKEAKSGNKELVNQVRHIGNKFLNAVEISAQEAVYLVLQMPLLINTSIPDDRAFLLKPIEKLQDIPDNSDDIESDNVIKRHQRRPNKLKNLCLADFVAWYNCTKQN